EQWAVVVLEAEAAELVGQAQAGAAAAPEPPAHFPPRREADHAEHVAREDGRHDVHGVPALEIDGGAPVRAEDVRAEDHRAETHEAGDEERQVEDAEDLAEAGEQRVERVGDLLAAGARAGVGLLGHVARSLPPCVSQARARREPARSRYAQGTGPTAASGSAPPARSSRRGVRPGRRTGRARARARRTR